MAGKATIIRDLSLETLIEESAYTKLYSGKKRGYTNKIVIKQILKNSLDSKLMENFMQDIKQYKEKIKTDCKNVIEIIDIHETQTNLYISMPYAELGNIVYYKSQKIHEFTENHIKMLFDQIMNGIDEIHKLGKFHGNIKPSNILVFQGPNIFVSDHFHANLIKMNETVKFNSYDYIAPEICESRFKKKEIENQPFQSDYWSAGVILYWILYEESPFSSNEKKNPETYLQAMKEYSGQKLRVPPGKKKPESKILWEILTKLITYDAKQRLTYEQYIKYVLEKTEPPKSISILGSLDKTFVSNSNIFVPSGNQNNSKINFTSQNKAQSSKLNESMQNRNEPKQLEEQKDFEKSQKSAVNLSSTETNNKLMEKKKNFGSSSVSESEIEQTPGLEEISDNPSFGVFPPFKNNPEESQQQNKDSKIVEIDNKKSDEKSGLYVSQNVQKSKVSNSGHFQNASQHSGADAKDSTLSQNIRNEKQSLEFSQIEGGESSIILNLDRNSELKLENQSNKSNIYASSSKVNENQSSLLQKESSNQNKSQFGNMNEITPNLSQNIHSSKQKLEFSRIIGVESSNYEEIKENQSIFHTENQIAKPEPNIDEGEPKVSYVLDKNKAEFIESSIKNEKIKDPVSNVKILENRRENLTNSVAPGKEPVSKFQNFEPPKQQSPHKEIFSSSRIISSPPKEKMLQQPNEKNVLDNQKIGSKNESKEKCEEIKNQKIQVVDSNSYNSEAEDLIRYTIKQADFLLRISLSLNDVFHDPFFGFYMAQLLQAVYLLSKKGALMIKNLEDTIKGKGNYVNAGKLYSELIKLRDNENIKKNLNQLKQQLSNHAIEVQIKFNQKKDFMHPKQRSFSEELEKNYQETNMGRARVKQRAKSCFGFVYKYGTVRSFSGKRSKK